MREVAGQPPRQGLAPSLPDISRLIQVRLEEGVEPHALDPELASGHAEDQIARDVHDGQVGWELHGSQEHTVRVEDRADIDSSPECLTPATARRAAHETF